MGNEWAKIAYALPMPKKTCATDIGAAAQQAMAEVVRVEMARLKMTVAELSRRSDVPYRTLVRYVDGDRPIPVDVLAQVAVALDVPMTELVHAAATAPSVVAALYGDDN